MNTFWLKLAGAAIGITAIVIVASMFASKNTPKPAEPEKSFYDQAQNDQKSFLAEPEKVKVSDQTPTTQTQNEVAQTPAVQPNQPVQQTPPVQPRVQQPEPAQPTTLYFKELGEIEQIEAERQLNIAAPGFSVGRLPMTGYKGLAVDPCRRIIQKWPDSFYAYQAKRILAALPFRYQTRYKITEQETDLSMYSKQRPGTKPFEFKEQN